MTDSVALIIIGNEVLSGKVRDANSPYLIDRLRALGAELAHIDVLPDRLDVIAACVRARSAEHRFVITVGGVGPTHDDVTMAALARAFDEELVIAPSLVERLRARYGAEGMTGYLKMAEVPASVEVEDRSGDSWPTVRVHNVFPLPGTPSLVQRGFSAIAEKFRGVPFALERVYLRLEEGELAGTLSALERDHPRCALGSYPTYDLRDDYRVLVVIESRDPTAVSSARDALLEAVGPDAVVRWV